MTISSTKAKTINVRKASKKAGPASEYVIVNASVGQFKLSDRLSVIASDPRKATDFLKRAGIITKAGSLAPEYA